MAEVLRAQLIVSVLSLSIAKYVISARALETKIMKKISNKLILIMGDSNVKTTDELARVIWASHILSYLSPYTVIT
jgi:hypothetical protein